MAPKTIIITGCSSGLGYHTAIYLAQQDYQVYASVRRNSDLNLFTHLPPQHQPRPFLLDLRWSQSRISKIISSLPTPPEVLINNAGYGFFGTLDTISVDHLQQQLEVNLYGTYKVIKAVLPSMRSRRAGLIINISSILGLFSLPGYGPYSISKFSIEALTQTLRHEETPFGIKTVSLNPGSFCTNFWKNSQLPRLNSKRTLSPHQRFNSNLKASFANPRRQHTRSHPLQVAKVINQLISTQNYPANVPIGLDAQLLYYLHRLLPRPLFFWIVKTIAHAPRPQQNA